MPNRPAALLACAAVFAGALAGQAAAESADGLAAAIAAPTREARLVARDPFRHPAQELAFFGVGPDAHVVEIWPDAGYWTEILAPFLAARGNLVAAVSPADGGDEVAAFHARFQGRPGFGTVAAVVFDRSRTAVAPPASADFVLTFRNVHNWMADGYAEQAFAAFFAALKPGGILGVEEHRGLAAVPQDPKAANGYVRQDYVVGLAEKAGFHLVESSEIDANPRDTKDYKGGVWTLPPTFALQGEDRARYAAIGEADNMVLKFRKPAP